MFFKNQTISGGLAVPPVPLSWKIPPKVRGIINETVPILYYSFLSESTPVEQCLWFVHSRKPCYNCCVCRAFLSNIIVLITVKLV